MPWYRVTYLPTVLDDLRATEQPMAQRLLDKTKWLASNVANLRHDPLHPDLPGMIQYAVGNWRILYAIVRAAIIANPSSNHRGRGSAPAAR